MACSILSVQSAHSCVAQADEQAYAMNVSQDVHMRDAEGDSDEEEAVLDELGETPLVRAII